MTPAVIWSARHWADAIAALPTEGALPARTVLVPREAVAHSLRRELIRSGQAAALIGTRFLPTLAAAVAVLHEADIPFETGEEALRPARLLAIFRRDLRASSGKSAVEETLELLEHRKRRTGVDQKSPRDRLTELARRGILEYAERAVLLDRSDARWRLGHGSPVTFQLLTGSGMLELVQASLVLLRRLILDHRRFVFVPSAPSAREILTIGNALRPLEYAIVDTPLDALLSVADGGYRGEGWGPVGKDVKCFVKEVGPRIVVGVYRVSHLAPAQMFYAHVDHAHDAALIAMADSALQEHRGFPLLVDLADKLCTASFGGETLAASTRLAYAAAGAPYRYLAERKTR